jgi:hypothetical protein
MLNSLIGIIASSGGAPASLNSYESIATLNVTSAVSSISFSSIPATYQHLQIRYIARSTRVTSGSYLIFQANSDTANNYANHGLFGTGATAGSYAVTATNEALEAYVTSAGDSASIFGACVCDVLDYASTSKYKTFRGLTGADVNGTNGQLRFSSGVWMNTAAITSITIKDGNGANLDTYSSFALYGIKG